MDGIGADQLCVKELPPAWTATVKGSHHGHQPYGGRGDRHVTWPSLIKPLGIKNQSALPMALPVGSSLEYADETTLYPRYGRLAAKCDARLAYKTILLRYTVYPLAEWTCVLQIAPALKMEVRLMAQKARQKGDCPNREAHHEYFVTGSAGNRR